jgi:adenylate cyclase|tara:strand:- start:582 stop:2435 length:1854 start_codon:yes stop_codon:yes gene_type:complete
MKYITSIWTTIFIAAVLIGVRISDPALVEQLRLNTFDTYIKTITQRESTRVILLNLGEDSLSVMGQYPFPREVYAQMISDLRGASAGLVGFTIMFPEADRFGGDEIFASWVKNNGIILAQDADENGNSKSAPYVGTAIFGTGNPLDWAIRYKGLVTNIPEIEAGAWGHGLINAMPEVDGLVRRIPLISQINNQLYPSFALETVRVLNEKPSYTVKVNDLGIEEVILRPHRITTDSNGSIWINPNYTFKEINYVPNSLPNLEGSVVLIGLTAKGLSSQIPTPSGLRSAHSLQAAALETILSGDSISRPVWADLLEIAVILIGVSFIILSIYYLSITTSLVTFILTLGLTSAGVFYFWNESQILIDISYSLIIFILVFTSGSFNNFYKQFMLRQLIKKQFETYLDPKQVYLLQKNPELLRLGGDRKEMTFLFMDICGFTPISEYYKNNDDPEGLVLLVNEFLDAMTKIILANGGTIDKYMGDCVMAFWNAPLPCDNHAEMAVKSAIEIEAKTNELKETYKARGLPDINVGTGINTGDCIVGNMGSESRFDYSVIGDAVNLAARLEATAARHEYVEYKTIISSYTKDLLPDHYTCVNIGDIKVKGKDELITIYSPSYKKI